MNKVLVAVFENEDRARRASRALDELVETDAIRVNATAIVVKGRGGAITVSDLTHPAPESAMGATAVGILIGMLAGGVGLAVGAAAGLVVGTTADLFYLKVGRDFLADVERTLEPGKSALVAQIYEEDTAAVDARLADLGAVVFRRPVGEVADQEYLTAVSGIKGRMA